VLPFLTAVAKNLLLTAAWVANSNDLWPHFGSRSCLGMI
jgi:hypothetical protein